MGRRDQTHPPWPSATPPRRGENGEAALLLLPLPGGVALLPLPLLGGVPRSGGVGCVGPLGRKDHEAEDRAL